MAEGVEGLVLGDQTAILGQRTLTDHNDRRVVGLEPGLDPPDHLVEIERLLGDQDDVGSGGEPRVQCDPAGVAPHHLDDENSVVGFRRGVEAVNGL
ncbi:unannotated protein [freshwater metagenome]|uniref:Unannotated protein n=1 Tax=freshwater metagenome TaxID=449393 RepID=A0A6J7C392_9ZZZZ